MKTLWTLGTFIALALLLALVGPCAYAQQEVDPEHFDSPSTEAIAQPRTVDSKVRLPRLRGTFSLPYSVRCNGRTLAPGKYSVSLRADGRVGHATLSQKGRIVEITGIVQMAEPKQRNEVVPVEDLFWAV